MAKKHEIGIDKLQKALDKTSIGCRYNCKVSYFNEWFTLFVRNDRGSETFHLGQTVPKALEAIEDLHEDQIDNMIGA